MRNSQNRIKQIANASEALMGEAQVRKRLLKIQPWSDVSFPSAPVMRIMPIRRAIRPEKAKSARAFTPKITNGFDQRL